MSYFTTTLFLTKDTRVRPSAGPTPALYIHPGGISGGYLTLQFDELSAAERLEIATRLATAAAEWRDTLAAAIERERTTADELAAARAEIARLRDAAEGQTGATV